MEARLGRFSNRLRTTIGTSYTVTFLQATNPGVAGQTSSLRVEAAGVTQDYSQTNNAGTTFGNVQSQFVEQTFTFTATGTNTTLSFASLNAGLGGSLLAAVSVSATSDTGNDTISDVSGTNWISGNAGNDSITAVVAKTSSKVEKATIPFGVAAATTRSTAVREPICFTVAPDRI